MQYTEEQLQVITSRGENLLVSAAAGSGKTAVLVERILQRVMESENPVDIDRLLIVTFTSAAAAEMRERIDAAIGKALEAHPEDVHLQRQSTLVHNAQIMTIDSFCLFIIRNNFNDIGLDPSFRVADEGEVRLLEEDTMAELLEEEFACGREAFLQCVETYSTGGREQNLEQCILELYHYALSYPWPEEWLEKCKSSYTVRNEEELERSDFVKLCLMHTKMTVEGCKELAQEALRLCERPDGPYMYAEALEQDLEVLNRLEGCDTFRSCQEAFTNIKFKTLSSKKDSSVDAQVRQQTKELRDRVKAILQELQKKYFTVMPEKIVEQCVLCAPAVEELVSLGIRFKRRMDEKKRERGVLDFSDMEHFALEILLDHKVEDGRESCVPTPTALDYREHYAEIMTDEYQDSNLVQEYLLGSIAGKNNRFMVGDVKQSIYKFRLARPELFLEKQKSYGSEGADGRVILLHKNFRSRAEVLDSVNYVFGRIMDSSVGGITYTPEEALHLGAQYEAQSDASPDSFCTAGELLAGDAGRPNATEVLLVKKAGELSGEELEDKQKEAAVIAARIRELVGHFQVTDKASGRLRPARYSDIVILLRSGAGYDEAFRSILEEEGIPAYITSKTGYFLTTEIRTVLQLLRILDNPLQDIPLYGVLTSMFGGFTEEEIACIRGETTTPEARRKTALYTSLKQYAQSQPDSAPGVKAQGFLDWLAGWRERTVYQPIHELLRDLLRESHYMQYVTALPGGEKRRANVELLLEKAKSFEKTSFYGLFHFIRYLEKIEKYEIDQGEAEILEESADLVRIMTIHKSKGLEFPICFVAGLSKRFNMRDTTKMLLTDLDMGVGTDAVDLARRTVGKTLRKSAMAAKMHLDALGEELRVLYVAMTRAKEKLILTGIVENGEKWEKQLLRAKQTSRMGFLQISRASCYLDLLLPVLLSEADAEEVPFSVYLTGTALLTVEQMKKTVSVAERRAKLREMAYVYGPKEDNAACGAVSEPVGVQTLAEQIRRRFESRYAHENLANLYTKTTVSELKKAAMQDTPDLSFRLFKEEEIVPYIPGFMREEESVSGTTRGSAFHKVLELLPLERLVDVSKLSGKKELCEACIHEMDELAAKGVLSQEYRETVNPWKIAGFLQSSLAARMTRALKAGQLYREQPFVLGIPASRLGEEFPEEEMVLVQGIIDVCFVEDGHIILADYKTDVVENPEDLVARYHTQLDYYAEALERLMKLPVTEKIIYSFRFEGEIEVG